MFYYISGTLAYKGADFAVIDAGGVGYQIYVSASTLDSLGAEGSSAKLYTYLNFKSASDIMDLYGFATPEEKALFEMLIGVNRVGAKLAMSVLSAVSPSKFALCVVTNDAKYLAEKTSGLGLKGAQRLILELKDKFKGVEMDDFSGEDFADVPMTSGDTEGDALAALVVLGYKPQEARQAIAGLTGSVEEIVKRGLQNLMKQ